MKLYFFLALILVAVSIIIYVKYKKSEDTKELLHNLAAISLVIFFTYVSKVIFVHKPIFIVHLAFVILSWGSLFFYLVKRKLNLWFLLSPAVTTIIFVIMALFFREHG